ncbi:IclR family transcriptional regulator [Ferviditalea candida]|uniref:IclR family transcriptional regulator n=1 Tax=Ferviditalea candida TaxID=3108399 RepID=A0ABU5ZNB3_9BACL|nr:IclR family transcriptional regulator [Paenibacillaceae bacterium T2]
MRDVNMGSIRSIDRAIDILQTFSIEKPYLTVEEIAKATKIPNSTVYRILCTLERRGLVQFDEKTATYKLGLRMLEFSYHLNSVLDIKQEAKDLLTELHQKTNQTVLMAVREGDQIIYIFKKEKYEGLKFSSYVGQRRPFIYGILGPVLLAHLPDAEITRILSVPVQKHTQYTVTNEEQILVRLRKIKQDGYYIESNETTVGVTGIGAPVFDINGKVMAAIGVVGPSIQIDDQIEHIKPLLLDTSCRVSLRMGYRSEQ